LPAARYASLLRLAVFARFLLCWLFLVFSLLFVIVFFIFIFNTHDVLKKKKHFTTILPRS
jgi:hypothetical protein